MLDRIAGRPETWPPELVSSDLPVFKEEPPLDGQYESIVGRPETWPPGTFDQNPNHPPPTISALEPPSAALGDPSFTLHIKGGLFTPGSVIVWNGSDEPTTFVSWTEVTTQVNMATAEVAMAIPVAVRGANGLTGAPVMFDLQEPAGRESRRRR